MAIFEKLFWINVKVFILYALTSTILLAQIDYLNESQVETKIRLKWFNDAKYGMFIHFGLYSQLGGEW